MCKSQKNTAIFYDENDNNRAKEIETFNNQLFILGQHHLIENDIEKCVTILCLDTLVKKNWEINLGDRKKRESFENFTIDKKGNFYVTGYNDGTKSALLLKINPTGQIIWQKEFRDILSLNEIRCANDTSIIVVGVYNYTKSESELIKDSSFIQKIDSSGNTIWKQPICKNGTIRFLELSDNKIIFCSNLADITNLQLNSICYVLNMNGKFEQIISLDQASTGIELGVKVVQLKIDEKKRVNIFCMSHNTHVPKIKLVQIDLEKKKLLVLEYDKEIGKMNKKENDKIFMFSGMVINEDKKETRAIVAKQNDEGEMYLSYVESDDESYITSVELNNSTYSIGNRFVPGEFKSKWIVKKEN